MHERDCRSFSRMRSCSALTKQPSVLDLLLLGLHSCACRRTRTLFPELPLKPFENILQLGHILVVMYSVFNGIAYGSHSLCNFLLMIDGETSFDLNEVLTAHISYAWTT